MEVSVCLVVATALFYSISEHVVEGQEIESLKASIADLTKHVMMLQLSFEERARMDGNSGVKVVRGLNRGYKNYHSDSHLNPGTLSMHDHADYDRTIGFGEFSAVMNGVGFRTRHNDYKLVMPSRTSRNFHAWENIPFPNVPPEVLAKSTVAEQITELREWFRAFHNQNRSHRDYTKYFKAVLCYLEGAWTLDKQLEEPFPSDRHQLEARSWEELHNKNHFYTLAGVKNRLENIAHLPTSIMEINSTTGLPVYAQWNYRIMCSPVNRDIPHTMLYQENDLAFGFSKNLNLQDVAKTRAARYRLYDSDRNIKNTTQILDEIFAGIPGKDNHGANLSLMFDSEVMYDSTTSTRVRLNTGYYHRSYKSEESGAGGVEYAAMGFNDDNMWMAMTSQPRIAPFYSKKCPKSDNRNAPACQESEIRISQAIPLELIYLTPLLSWNPHNISYNNDTTTAKADRRDGQTAAKAFNGVDKTRYYITPAGFFTGAVDSSDPADTVKSNFVYVLDSKRQPQQVAASGTRIFLPVIGDIGPIRLRYPIAPIYDEGSSQWKELNAVKDKVLKNETAGLTRMKQSDTVVDDIGVNFEMAATTNSQVGLHTHEITISKEQNRTLVAGQSVDVTTSRAQGHTHDLTITFVAASNKFRYTKCDGKDVCFDGHGVWLTLKAQGILSRL